MTSLMAEMFPVFTVGVRSTILFSIGSVGLGFCVGVLICAMRLGRSRSLYVLSSFYVSAMRGMPLFVQLLIAYYCLPLVGFNVSPEVSALLTLAACTGAYQAEILRGGFLGIPPGQIEAARMSGLNSWQILRHIQVPQAVRLTFPSLLNEAVAMVKASSLISAVGVLELTRAAQNIAASTYRPLPVYLTAGAIYLVITVGVSVAGAILERRLRVGQAS
ncbi:amino acid ABC transporter permease [Breoghania sp.]|uniref:amino acid ABC transporter permease n=1 Tax=Breoghania sp. TaxID=2065378 RepID=UPI002AA723B8|nr:amino acid ABC transporter permease [Breoghania sp.]